MNRRFTFLLFFSLSLLFMQCKKDDNPTGPGSNGATFTDNIKAVQENGDNLLAALLSVKDTASALDSVLKVFLKDSTVQTGGVNTQGIWVKYKNGIMGGILLNPEDGEPLTLNKYDDVPLIPVGSGSFLPTSKKTVFVNPSYTERTANANLIINLYNNIFPKIGYTVPVKYLDNAATIDVMTNLAGYGIVHIYSHGWAYPNKNSITEVYLMTGEEVNAATNEKYKNELFNGSIPVIKVHNSDDKYFISPSFFASKNNFQKDSTIMYGGFCYSFLGGWPNAVLDVAKAGAYTGFTWRVETNWNASLSRSLFDTLSNNTLKDPRTLDYWFTQTPAIAKQKWDPGDNKFCKIQYTGHSDLALWVNVSINVSPNPANAKPNENIMFTAKSKTKLTQQVKYKWNFGDNTAEQTVANDSTVNHTYTTEGSYNVTVTVYDMSDNQIAKAYSIAVIESAPVIPDFNRVNVSWGMRVMNSWTAVGKYVKGGGDFILRDTSYGGVTETGFGGNENVTVTFSGSSFSGQQTYTNSGNTSVITVNGSYSSSSKTISATITYTYSGAGISSNYTMTQDYTVSINSLPVQTSPTEYGGAASGMEACTYISTATFHQVQTPIPPAGVTQPGIKFTYNYQSFFCEPIYSHCSITLTKI